MDCVPYIIKVHSNTIYIQLRFDRNRRYWMFVKGYTKKYQLFFHTLKTDLNIFDHQSGNLNFHANLIRHYSLSQNLLQTISLVFFNYCFNETKTLIHIGPSKFVWSQAGVESNVNKSKLKRAESGWSEEFMSSQLGVELRGDCSLNE